MHALASFLLICRLYHAATTIAGVEREQGEIMTERNQKNKGKQDSERVDNDKQRRKGRKDNLTAQNHANDDGQRTRGEHRSQSGPRPERGMEGDEGGR
jgi:hypothetical protein